MACVSEVLEVHERDGRAALEVEVVECAEDEPGEKRVRDVTPAARTMSDLGVKKGEKRYSQVLALVAEDGHAP